MKIVIPYKPREAFIPFHKRKERFAALVCHRRAGKTVAVLNDIVKEVLMEELPNPRGIFVAPTFAQAKDIAWQYLKQYTYTVPAMEYHEAELRATFPTGATIRLYGAENPDRLRGIYADIAGIDEPAAMDLAVWTDVIRPALSDRKGKAVFIGTPNGEDDFFDIYEHARDDKDWYSMILKASESGILSEEELTSARKLLTPEAYQLEYEVSFSAAYKGAFYAGEIEKAQEEGRIKLVPRDPLLPVYSAFDLGMDDSTAIWTFQVYNLEWRWLDYYENSGKGMDHYITWLKNRDYPIDTTFLPHDAQVRELLSGKSRKQHFEERGLNPFVLERSYVEDGINAVRLAFPKMWFNKETTKIGIKALRNYRTDYNSKNRVLQLKPKHDWSSHAADAMRTAVMGVNEYWEKDRTNWRVPIKRNLHVVV